MLQKMLLRGSQGASKAQLAEEIESMGARIEGETGREISSLNFTCFKGDLSRAVAMVGDVISNPTIDSAELEVAKAEQTQENEAMSKN